MIVFGFRFGKDREPGAMSSLREKTAPDLSPNPVSPMPPPKLAPWSRPSNQALTPREQLTVDLLLERFRSMPQSMGRFAEHPDFRHDVIKECKRLADVILNHVTTIR